MGTGLLDSQTDLIVGRYGFTLSVYVLYTSCSLRPTTYFAISYRTYIFPFACDLLMTKHTQDSTSTTPMTTMKSAPPNELPMMSDSDTALH